MLVKPVVGPVSGGFGVWGICSHSGGLGGDLGTNAKRVSLSFGGVWICSHSSRGICSLPHISAKALMGLGVVKNAGEGSGGGLPSRSVARSLGHRVERGKGWKATPPRLGGRGGVRALGTGAGGRPHAVGVGRSRRAGVVDAAGAALEHDGVFGGVVWGGQSVLRSKGSGAACAGFSGRAGVIVPTHPARAQGRR